MGEFIAIAILSFLAGVLNSRVSKLNKRIEALEANPQHLYKEPET